MAARRKRALSRAGKPESQPETPTEKKRPKIDDLQPMQTDGPEIGGVVHGLQVSAFTDACSRIGELLGRVNDLKGSRDENIDECKGDVSLLVMKLKQLNREAQLRCKEARDKTNDARQRIDDQHLQLQNMLYQVMHLQKEIHECLEFKSGHEDIELVPLEQFYEEAPKAISNPAETRRDPHKRMLARLHWELEQRKRLTCQLEASTADKQKIQEDIELKQQFLSDLQPQLDAIMKATIPVQEQMGVLFERRRTQHALALYLPQPLYVLFVQASAYQEALDQTLNVSIEGDAEEAKVFASRAPLQVDEGRGSDSDREERQSQKRKKRRRTVDQAILDKQDNLMKTHPLSVRFTVKCNGQATVSVDFHNIVALGIVTVKVSVDSEQLGDLLDPSSLLNKLFPGDTGHESPNPANAFQMRRLGLDADAFDTLAGKVGLPYKWAQWIAGLDFLSDTPVESAPSFAAGKMELVVETLKQRLESRLTLQQQIQQLDSLVVPNLPGSESLFPHKVKTKVVSWNQLTQEEVDRFLDGRSERTTSMVKSTTDYCYQAILQHDNVKLTALVVVNVCYPKIPPLFIISVSGEAGTCTSDNDLNIKALEAELNVYCDELVHNRSPDSLLSLQIRRLQMCFDVYLQCNQAEGDRNERLWSRLSCGKDRRLPYVYQCDPGFFRPR